MADDVAEFLPPEVRPMLDNLERGYRETLPSVSDATIEWSRAAWVIAFLYGGERGLTGPLVHRACEVFAARGIGPCSMVRSLTLFFAHSTGRLTFGQFLEVLEQMPNPWDGNEAGVVQLSDGATFAYTGNGGVLL